MQTNESSRVDPSDLPGSDQDASATDGLSDNLMSRLMELEPWRIDVSSLEFLGDTKSSHGKNATVSKALLNASPDAKLGTTRTVRPDESPTLVGPRHRSNEPNPESEARKHENGQNQEGDEGTDKTIAEGKMEEEQGPDSKEKSPGSLKTVAVKKMKVEGDPIRVLGLTVREAEFLVQISHPNIITLEGFVEDRSNDIIWLVFPWGDNGNLKDFVASRDWEIPERIHLIFDVTQGVAYLHSLNPPIYHGDLKSINILVNSEYRAVITDFGSARRLTDEDPASKTERSKDEPHAEPSLTATFCATTNTITLTGNKYTLRWAAPELLLEDKASLGCDIWALGWVAYEIMTNSIPFEDVLNDRIVIKRVVQGELPSVTEHARMSLTQALCSLITKCLSVDATARPTAEYIQKSIVWMPNSIPNPTTQSTDRAVPKAHTPKLLMELGWTCLWRGDHLNASSHFTEALDIYTSGNDDEGKAHAMGALGDCHRLGNEYDAALTLYSRAHKINTEIGYSRGIAFTLWGQAEVHRMRREGGKAIKLYLDALDISTKAGINDARADALLGLADIHKHQGFFSQADEFYSKASQIYTHLGYTEGKASVFMGQAIMHMMRKDYDGATSSFSEALQIHIENGDKVGEAGALHGLAEVCRLQNEYSQATTRFSKALQIFTDIGNQKGKADTLMGLAQVHEHQKEYGQAIASFSEAASIRKEIGDSCGAASALWSLAEAHRLQGEYEQALESHSEALQIRTDIGDGKGTADSWLGLANVRRDQGNSEAIRLYERAAGIYGNIGDHEAANAARKEAASARQ